MVNCTNVTAKSDSVEQCKTQGIAIAVFEEEPAKNSSLSFMNKLLGGRIERLIKSGEIRGKWKEVNLLHLDKDTPSHLFVIGMGKRSEFTLERLRSFAAIGSRAMKKSRLKNGSFITVEDTNFTPCQYAETLTEGVILGLYKFSKYKTKSQDDDSNSDNNLLQEIIFMAKDADSVTDMNNGIKQGMIISKAVNLTRDLVNEPSNNMTPSLFIEQANTALSKLPVEVTVLDADKIRDIGMGAFSAVAKGSDEPSKMLILKYNGSTNLSNKQKKSEKFDLGIVGKGVTFDSGGISIKPSDQMHTMTSDMAGAAVVVGTFNAVAQLKLPISILGIVPLTENLPSGKAYKPGDIIKAYNGKTIEVINTDAEGRLILADALSYAAEQGASQIIDLATLTGACVVALGHAISGLFSTSQELIDTLVTCGNETHERVWPMPLLEEYTQTIKGTLADLKNTGGRPAGSCTAAAFLKEFVADTQWAHIDIAGTTLIEGDKSQFSSYQPDSGATGIGVRLMVRLVEKLIQKKQTYTDK